MLLISYTQFGSLASNPILNQLFMYPFFTQLLIPISPTQMHQNPYF